MNITQVMQSPVTTISEKARISEVAKLMCERNVSTLLVQCEDESLHGPITDRDLVTRVLAAGKDPLTATAGELPGEDLAAVDAVATVEEALASLTEQQLRWLLVIDKGEVVGLVDAWDLRRRIVPERMQPRMDHVSAA